MNFPIQLSRHRRLWEGAKPIYRQGVPHRKKEPVRTHDSDRLFYPISAFVAVLTRCIKPNQKRKTANPNGNAAFYGAARQIRTADLVLTKDALYLLSYSSGSRFQLMQRWLLYTICPGMSIDFRNSFCRIAPQGIYLASGEIL